MESNGKWISWNENIRHNHRELFTPESEEEIIQIVRGTNSRLRVFGERKSSADIAAGTETLISLNKYQDILSIDKEKKEICVQSGITLKKLLVKIEDLGWAIPCLPDIDEITLGGALATGTHGTGKNGHLLSQYVISMRIITASGEVLEVEEDSDLIEAFRLSIGLLGITSTVRLQCIESYSLQLLERPVSDKKWLSQYRDLVEKHDFTRILWLPHTNHGYVITGDVRENPENKYHYKTPWWHKYRRTVSAFLYKYTTNYPKLTVLANRIIYALFFTSKVSHFGTLYEATVTKSRGSTLELAEWTIDLNRFETLFLDLKKSLNDRNNQAYAHIPMDIRFIRADKTWLSYAYKQDTVTIGCVSRHASKADSYEAFEIMEEIFLKHGGRPHYAKRFKAGRIELEKMYPRWDDFIELRRKMDPKGRFLNQYLDKIYS